MVRVPVGDDRDPHHLRVPGRRAPPASIGRVPTRRIAAALGVIALAVTAAACGEDKPAAEPVAIRTADDGTVFNDADVAFATAMIPHHAEAVQMVVLADGRPLAPEVEALAQQIRDTQVAEVEQMTDWLTDWGEEVPETSLDHVNAGHDSDGLDDHGGSHDDAMSALAEASDAEFEELWLEAMIEHHEGAVTMAGTEQEDGANDDVVALAAAIVDSQQDEIEEMRSLLGS